MKQPNRLQSQVYALAQRLDKLADESLDIFIAERPFLYEATDQPIISTTPELAKRKRFNELASNATKKRLVELLPQAFPTKAPVVEQTGFLPEDEQIKNYKPKTNRRITP